MTDAEININMAVARKLHGEEWRMWSAEDYCHSIGAAWEGTYKAWIRKGNETEWSQLNESAPKAICLAFLKLP